MATAADHHGASRPVGVSKSKKVGRHLRVDEQGAISYKKTPSAILMESLQLGLSHAIGGLEPKPKRDILVTDFDVIETVDFPSQGSEVTQAHKNKDFTFKTYSPVAFRFFREAFQIKPDDYLLALCHQPLRELSNPGASGSLFYLSSDDDFIIKTVQKKEAKFLQKLLPGYYLNLTQNKKTLLPKFFGMYQYRCGSVKIRIVVMNNLLPTSISYAYKFDLKGSTYKRQANQSELTKSSPTYKDLDIMRLLPDGIMLPPEKYDLLTKTIQRDCQVLESFSIMDYSLLLGIHSIDKAIKDGQVPASDFETTDGPRAGRPVLVRTQSYTGHQSKHDTRKEFALFEMETVALDDELETTRQLNYPEGFIQGRIQGSTEQGERVLLYLGIIDILQSYRLKKKLEHTWKSIVSDGDTVSVHNPTFYKQRFQTFLEDQVFRREKTRIRPRRNSQIARRPRPGLAHGGVGVASIKQTVRRKGSREADGIQNSPYREAAKDTGQGHLQSQPSLEVGDIDVSLDAPAAAHEGEGKGVVTFDLKEVSSDFSTTLGSTSTPARGGPVSKLHATSAETGNRSSKSSVGEVAAPARQLHPLAASSTGDD